MPPFEFGAGAGRDLRGNQHDRARPQSRQAAGEPVSDESHVGHVVFVYGRVVAHPQNVRRAEGCRIPSEGKVEAAADDPLLQ